MNAESQTFNQRFDQYGQWRMGVSRELETFARWLVERNLADGGTLERLKRLQEKTFSGKMTVAFVAEFSRGKSELINALFFASYGRRIMPASAGRTTMCPTELTWDEEFASNVRLLPIETRKLPAILADWRLKLSSWTEIPVDVRSADSLAGAVAKVTETIFVSMEEAKALGFDLSSGEFAMKNGKVEVPKWRHAIVNFPHPLLKKGMVILDTPGLNAIGSEPELTVSLLPQAQAVVFILGADTGVTRSDLHIWQDQLCSHVDAIGLRLVVLNKIDILWDELSSKENQDQAIRKQRQNVAQTLEWPLNHVLAVSAQKALVAKINKDPVLLKASALRQLESVLVESLLGQRHQILNKIFLGAIGEIRMQAEHLLNMRMRDVTEQAFEISGLQGKNTTAMRSVRMRMARERKEFDVSVSRILGLRAAHNKMLNEVFQMLSGKTVKRIMSEMTTELQKKVVTIGSHKLYARAFEQLQEVLENSQEMIHQIQRMLMDAYTNLNTEFGFSLQTPDSLNLQEFSVDVQKIAQSNQHLFSVTNALKMTSTEFSERLNAAIAMRLRSVFEAAANELELWGKSSTSQLDVQLRDRRQSFAARSETMERIQQADMDLNVRLKELDAERDSLKRDDRTLHAMARNLMQVVNDASNLQSDQQHNNLHLGV